MTDQAPDDRAAGPSAGPSATTIGSSAAEGGAATHDEVPAAGSPRHAEIAALAQLYERLKAGLGRLLESRAPCEDWVAEKTQSAIDAFSGLAGALATLIQIERLVAGQPAESGAVEILAEKLAAAQRAMAALMPPHLADPAVKPADPAA